MASSACPGMGGSCLYKVLTGSGHEAREPPPKTPRHEVDEQEDRLEKEVVRLQTESWRLQDLNECMRTELFFLESAPTRTKSSMSAYLDTLPMTRGDEDGDTVVGGSVDAESSSGSESEEPEVEKVLPEQPKAGRNPSKNRSNSKTVNFDESMNQTFSAGERKRHSHRGGRLEDEMGVFKVLDGPRSSSSSLSLFHVISSKATEVSGQVNYMVMKGSALSLTKPAQAVIYSIALGFVVFVLIATATHLGEESHDAEAAEDHSAGDHDVTGDAHARRLGGGTSPLMKNIAVVLAGSGLTTLLANALGMPLILGYVFGGVLVGPRILNIVSDSTSIADMSNLGLIFLLFMLGLEMDVRALVMKMGRIPCCTGFIQVPTCALFMTGLCSIFQAAGVPFGSGQYAATYCGIAGGMASSMIVVRSLEKNVQSDSSAGRLTIGVLMIQNVWALIGLALQINYPNPTGLGLLKTFAWLAALIIFSLAYAKFVMPAALFFASKSVELMLVLALAWCFFICMTAGLPFINLPMELAALVAGSALATFPYSAEFNAKIKYIRDFFFTLFFAGMGIMLPELRWETLGTCLLIIFTLPVVRFIGVFVPACAFGAHPRFASIMALNLCQVGEFALVLSALGVRYGHIEEETVQIIIISFTVLAVLTLPIIKHSWFIYSFCANVIDKLRGKSEEDHDIFDTKLVEQECDIMLLGFHKIAYMLVSEFYSKTPEQLKYFHVIDFNKNVLYKLSRLGITCTAGDIANIETLKRSQKQPPSIVISTIPDTMLQGIDNSGIVRNIKDLWPETRVIVTADGPKEAKALYHEGADYVLRMAKLSAERLHEVLGEQAHEFLEASRMKAQFDEFRQRDQLARGATKVLGGKMF